MIATNDLTPDLADFDGNQVALLQFVKQGQDIAPHLLGGGIVFVFNHRTQFGNGTALPVDQLPNAATNFIQPEIGSAGKIQQNEFATHFTRNNVV